MVQMIGICYFVDGLHSDRTHLYHLYQLSYLSTYIIYLLRFVVLFGSLLQHE